MALLSVPHSFRRVIRRQRLSKPQHLCKPPNPSSSISVRPRPVVECVRISMTAEAAGDRARLRWIASSAPKEIANRMAATKIQQSKSCPSLTVLAQSAKSQRRQRHHSYESFDLHSSRCNTRVARDSSKLSLCDFLREDHFQHLEQCQRKTTITQAHTSHIANANTLRFS